jgi:hypothetical protein
MNTNFVAHFEQYANARRFGDLSSRCCLIEPHLDNISRADIDTVCDGGL